MKRRPVRYKSMKPIVLNHQTIMMISLFRSSTSLDEMGFKFLEDYTSNGPRFWGDAATELFDQLQEEWCIGFVEALREKCDLLIKDHDSLLEEIKEKK